MSLAVHDDSLAPGLASTYGPFPILNDSSHSRDPHGLNAYLLHPEDGLWAYIEPTPAKRPLVEAVLVGNAQSEPAGQATQPPVQLKKQRSIALFLRAGGDESRKGLRRSFLSSTSLVGKKEPEPPTTPTLLSSRSSSAVSSISSNDSDGIRTPKDEVNSLGLAGIKLVDALAISQGSKQVKSKGWMVWMGKKRKEGSQGAIEQVAELHEVSPPPSLAPALRISNSSGPSAVAQDLLPVHHHLRAVSMRKLASLQAPSPHPLAEIFNQQIPFAPRRRARSFPASTNPPLTASDASERVKLLLTLTLENASQARPISDDLRFTRSSSPRIRQRSPAGISAFLNRLAFEERTVVYYHDHVSIVTPAHPENAVASIEFSPHLLALADATGGYSATRTPAPPSGPIDEIEAEQAGRVMEVVRLDVAVVEPEVVAVPVQAAESALEAETVVCQSPEKASRDISLPKVIPPTPPTDAAKPTAVGTGSSFRSSFVPRPVAPTWDDSSEEESDQADSSDEDEPLAIVAKRHSLAFPPNKRVQLQEPVCAPVDPERVAQEEKREAERQRRYREEVEKTRARRESSRRGDVERKIGVDAAGRPSASRAHSHPRPRPAPASVPTRTSTEPVRNNMSASTSRISLPPARTRTSSYPNHAPPLATRRSQSFYETPRASYPPPSYLLAPSRPMSMGYPAYGPMPMAMSMPMPMPMPMPGYPLHPPAAAPRSNRRQSHLPIQ